MSHSQFRRIKTYTEACVAQSLRSHRVLHDAAPLASAYLQTAPFSSMITWLWLLWLVPLLLLSFLLLFLLLLLLLSSILISGPGVLAQLGHNEHCERTYGLYSPWSSNQDPPNGHGKQGKARVTETSIIITSITNTIKHIVIITISINHSITIIITYYYYH